LGLFSGSLAKPEGPLLCGYVHELDRQFDRHNCQLRPQSTAWIVPSFLTETRDSGAGCQGHVPDPGPVAMKLFAETGSKIGR